MSDPVRDALHTLRRGQILDAAATVFSARGFRVATMRQVAEAAGVAHGTVYNYFSSKDDLIVALLERLNETEDRPHQFEGLLDGDLESRLCALMRHRLAHMRRDRRVLQAVLPEILANPTLRARYLDEVVAPSLALAEGGLSALGSGDVAPAHLVRAMAGSVLGLVVLDLLGDDTTREQADAIAATLARAFARGVLA